MTRPNARTMLTCCRVLIAVVAIKAWLARSGLCIALLVYWYLTTLQDRCVHCITLRRSIGVRMNLQLQNHQFHRLQSLQQYQRPKELQKIRVPSGFSVVKIIHKYHCHNWILISSTQQNEKTKGRCNDDDEYFGPNHKCYHTFFERIVLILSWIFIVGIGCYCDCRIFQIFKVGTWFPDGHEKLPKRSVWRHTMAL